MLPVSCLVLLILPLHFPGLNTVPSQTTVRYGPDCTLPHCKSSRRPCTVPSFAVGFPKNTVRARSGQYTFGPIPYPMFDSNNRGPYTLYRPTTGRGRANNGQITGRSCRNRDIPCTSRHVYTHMHAQMHPPVDTDTRIKSDGGTNKIPRYSNGYPLCNRQ